jgi:hypothetical protein
VRVRLVTPADAPLLVELFAQLSEQTARRRFFQPLRHVAAIELEALRVANGDPRRPAALADA